MYILYSLILAIEEAWLSGLWTHTTDIRSCQKLFCWFRVYGPHALSTTDGQILIFPTPKGLSSMLSIILPNQMVPPYSQSLCHQLTRTIQ